MSAVDRPLPPGDGDAQRRAAAVILLVLMIALGLPWSGPDPATSARPLLPVVVDPNDAPRHVLLALPRLGPVLTGALIAEREAAPYRSLNDIDVRVRGIGPATTAALSPHFRFREVAEGEDAEGSRTVAR